MVNSISVVNAFWRIHRNTVLDSFFLCQYNDLFYDFSRENPNRALMLQEGEKGMK